MDSIAIKRLIFAQYESEKEFPVCFNTLWKWLGYSTKGNAKAAFLECEFLTGQDFRVFLKNHKNPKGGRPTKEIYLTIDCAKSFCMMSRTQKGREVRQWYLQIEKEWRSRQNYSYPYSNPQTSITGRIREIPSTWEAFFESEVCKQGFKWFGAAFFWIFFYHWLNAEEKAYIERVNPLVNGRRKYRIHQFFKDEIREELKPKIVEVSVLVLSSTSAIDFMTRYSALYYGNIQQSLPLN